MWVMHKAYRGTDENVQSSGSFQMTVVVCENDKLWRFKKRINLIKKWGGLAPHILRVTQIQKTDYVFSSFKKSWTKATHFWQKKKVTSDEPSCFLHDEKKLPKPSTITPPQENTYYYLGRRQCWFVSRTLTAWPRKSSWWRSKRKNELHQSLSNSESVIHMSSVLRTLQKSLSTSSRILGRMQGPGRKVSRICSLSPPGPTAKACTQPVLKRN